MQSASDKNTNETRSLALKAHKIDGVKTLPNVCPAQALACPPLRTVVTRRVAPDSWTQIMWLHSPRHRALHRDSQLR